MLVGGVCHEASRSVLDVVAWIVLTRVELAVCVQALQRRARAPRITYRKRLNLVIRHVMKHTCGFKSIRFKHQLKLVGFADAAFEAQLGEPIAFASGVWRFRCRRITRRMTSPIALMDLLV